MVMIPIDSDAEDIPELLGYPGLMTRWMSSEMGITEREKGWKILRYLARNYLMENMVIEGQYHSVHWNSLQSDIFDINLEEVLSIEHPTDNAGKVNEEMIIIRYLEEAMTENQRLLWINNGFTLELIWFIAYHSNVENVRNSFKYLLDCFRLQTNDMWRHIYSLYGVDARNCVMIPNGRSNQRPTTIELAKLFVGG